MTYFQSRWRLSFSCALLLLAGNSCKTVEFYDMERFGDSVMELDDGPAEAHFYQKVFYSMEGSAFDITYAGAGKLWDFKSDPPLVPTDTEIQAALLNVGWSRLKLDKESLTIDLPAGMRVGLGGIAKGYGVDRAMGVLLKHGVEHGMVNAGGDLKALGKRFGKSWEIAIRHPRERDRVLALLPVSNTCVVTSGDYERFVDLDGRRYHHILDPRTGRPSSGCMSATVSAPDAAFADSLATALCVLAPDEGLRLVESLPRVEALLVGADGKVRYSTGLAPPKPTTEK